MGVSSHLWVLFWAWEGTAEHALWPLHIYAAHKCTKLARFHLGGLGAAHFWCSNSVRMTWAASWTASRFLSQSLRLSACWNRCATLTCCVLYLGILATILQGKPSSSCPQHDLVPHRRCFFALFVLVCPRNSSCPNRPGQLFACSRIPCGVMRFCLSLIQHPCLAFALGP